MKTVSLNQDYNLQFFIKLVRSVFNNTKPKIPSEPVDWQAIYDLAAAHSLSAVLYSAVVRIDADFQPDSSMMARLEQIYREQLVADINLSVETERLLSVLSDNGIYCMPVKGIVTKNDYPEPHLRTMSDVDILCKEADISNVQSLMLSQGYKVESIGSKDISYRKDSFLHFEMHSSLVETNASSYDYFTTVWERACFKDNGLIASMSLEDIYIFMLEHLANHLMFGGAGLRMFADVFLFLENHKSELDVEYVNSTLKALSLYDFEKKTKVLCSNWFSEDSEPDVSSDVARFVLTSATYGRASVAFAADTLKDSNASDSAAVNGFRRILSRAFPSIKLMRTTYVSVDKYPVLYPIFIPVHWINRLFIKRNVKAHNIGKYFVGADSEKVKSLRDIYISLGLKNRI